jgi:hypothetical protein
MLLEAETNKYYPGGYDIGAISNLITWVLNFFLSAEAQANGKRLIGDQMMTRQADAGSMMS